MKLGKRGIPTCTHCQSPAFDEVFRLTHHPTAVSPEDEELVFCSRRCLNEYFEELFLAAVNSRVAKETNEICRLVCPACKARVRQHGR